MPYQLTTTERPRSGSFGELHHRAVEQYAPPSVLVNEDLDIVHLSEHASRFLVIAGGEPTRQILRLVLPELRFELRGALYAARQPGHATGDTRIVRFADGGKQRSIELRVRPVEVPEAGRGTLLVLFDERAPPVEVATPAEPGSQHFEPVVREMEDELHRNREQLRTTIEQYETSLEELKASNEELTTLNHELKVKVDEGSRINGDLQNLMTSTDIGVLFLDRRLYIKRFTPRVQDLFNVIPSDIGRPRAHLTHRLESGDLPQAAAQVLVDLRTSGREVSSSDGKRFLVRMSPYRSIDDRIEGVVLTFVEITDLKAAQEARRVSEAALRTSEERLSLALRAAPLAVITHDNKLDATWAFVNGQQLDGALHVIFAPDNAERYSRSVREVYASGHAQRTELDVFTKAGARTYDFRIAPTREGQLVTGVPAIGFDIPPSKQAEMSLRDNDRHKDAFLAMLSHELRNPPTPLRIAYDVARLSSRQPARREPALDIIGQQLTVGDRLVDDLLDLSRIAQGKLKLVQTLLDPVRVVEAALESARPLIDEHRHKLEVRLPTPAVAIIGDFTRHVQVLSNLLLNAAKYTPDGGEITLAVVADVPRQRLVITVRDYGVGLRSDMLPRVFDMFAQAGESEELRDGGLGIGLNLVHQIIQLHGGTVAAHSDGPNRGSLFTIELALAPRDPT